ncbi:MAG: hypothetical protein QNJ12_00185 [Ilumatobacter sp.]|uniref:hypothetical protein n=1 Tax=Ilumatobacter sp. TaxID=1967498 RepID=UPI002638B569|nr:hypothetical protein [Ilumatobacter sp.]MDJ0767168.1 hypothetical protein [Ilumatobacter sp.]
MIFGDDVVSPVSVAASEWLAPACRGSWGTVGALVPNHYASILHVDAPEPDIEDWWSAYRRLFQIIASVGERHTSNADRAWFAVWEGHGFDRIATRVALPGPLDEAARQALERERARLREDDERRNAATRAALREVPRFALPDRSYYLVTGPVAAATRLRTPGSPERWQRPDLFWPDDRRWFVATDVDFWSLYIGGDHHLISEVARRVATPSELVLPDHQLVAED